MAKSAEAFRTISEVADWLGVQTHVLRFWESKFTQVKPVKRAGGRRYYRPADMQILGGIRKLLYEDGLTIKGAQKILREKGMAHVSALSPAVGGAEDDLPVAMPEIVEAIEAEIQTAKILPLVSKIKLEETVERLPLAQDETYEPVVAPIPKSVETIEESPADAPEPALEQDASAPDGIDPFPVIPAFLSRPTPQTAKPKAAVAEVEDAVSEAATTSQQKDKPAVEVIDLTIPEVEATEPEAPAPLAVKLPQAMAEHDIQTTPSVLAALSKVSALSTAQAASIAPLLAQLRVARDRMTQGRKE
jgi:DNA-binding transcriptional MerR regulator